MENKFETKIASELEELLFKPQERVWDNVLQAIQKKKKKSPYPLLFAIMGLSAIIFLTFYYLNSNKSNKENIVYNNDINTISQNVNKNVIKNQIVYEIKIDNKIKNNEKIEEKSGKINDEFKTPKNNIIANTYKNESNQIEINNKINIKKINNNKIKKSGEINFNLENKILNIGKQNNISKIERISKIENEEIDDLNEIENKNNEIIFQNEIALTKIPLNYITCLNIDKKITSNNILYSQIPNIQTNIIKLKKERKNKISFEMSLNSNYLMNYGLLTGSKEKSLNSTNALQTNVAKSNIVQFLPSSGFELGLGYQRKLNKNWNLVTGVSYLHKKIKSLKNNDFTFADTSSSMSTIGFNNQVNNRIYSLETNNIINTKNSFNYISVPVLLEKNIIRFKKVDITAIFGTSINFLINAKAIGSNNDGNILLPFNSKLNIVSPNLSFGLNFGFYGKFPVKIGFENEMGLLQISPLSPFDKKYFQSIQFKISLPIYKF